MTSIWYEDTLEPTDDDLDQSVRGQAKEGLTPDEIKQSARLTVKVHQPLFDRLAPPNPERWWRVKLRYEFAPLTQGWCTIFADCQVYVMPLARGEPVPIIRDIYPRLTYESEPQTIELTFGPEISVISATKVKIGEISTTVQFGQVMPATVGFIETPIDAREPRRDSAASHWHLRADRYPIIGLRDFWLALEQPAGCSGISLLARVDATLQRSLLSIHVGPKLTASDSRRAFIIQ